MDGPNELPDEPKRGGRRPKLTLERLQLIALALLDGNFKSVAARAAGVAPRTLNHWLKLGREFPNGIYGQLLTACQYAEAEFERRAVGELRSAGSDDPKYLCWLLERKAPHRWGRHRAELTELRELFKQVEDQLAEVEVMRVALEEERAELERQRDQLRGEQR